MNRRLRLRIRSLFRRRALDRDLEDELRFHLEMLRQDRADAQQQFGNLTALKEACRDMWTLGWLENVWQDVRYGLRTLARNPGFAAVAIIAMALGIGVNGTVFTLVNAVLYKNLPFAHSDRILYVSSIDRVNGGGPTGVSYPDFLDFRAQTKSFDAMGAASSFAGDVSDATGFAQNYNCLQVTANTFSLLGQKPIAGRDFNPSDEAPGAPPVAILTYGLWESRYARDPAIVGRTIRINTVPTTIIGVMPAGLRFPTESDLWVPLTDKRPDRTARSLTVYGHLTPGSVLKPARAELDAISRRLATHYTEDKDMGALVQDFNSMALRKKFRSMFLMLLVAAGFVLMIACANVANLMLSRAVDRAREISVRTALGAGRWRIVRQLLVESLMLAVAGGAIGWLVAIWSARAFDLAVIPTGKPAWIDFSLDYRVLAYLSAVSIGTGILFGLVPALRLSRTDVGAALKEGARGIGTSLRSRRLSGVLVVAEMALAVVLLAGAGLMLRGFLRVMAAPVGVNTANVLAMRLDLPKARYPRPDDQRAFYHRLKQRLEALPGVESAAVFSDLPGDGSMHFEYEIDGIRSRVGGLVIDPDYFRVMQAPVMAGRAFTNIDGPAVALVNQAFVNHYWPGQNPLGKTVGRLTVVGLAPDIAQSNSDLLVRDPLVYLPFQQEAGSRLFVAARTRVAPASLGAAFRRAVQAEDADLPVRDLITLDDHMKVVFRLLWVFGGLFVIFAAIALELAAVGLYAVVSHSVNQRTLEIGVRLAMGATAADVMRLIVNHGMRQLTAGLLLGLAGALATTRLLGDLLEMFGASPTDPVVFVGVAAVLTLAGLLGCAIPARRALRVDPALTLRHE